MKLLLVGGGGREHALAWKLKQDRPDLELIAAPGNPGIATLGRTVPVSAEDVDGITRLAREERADLVVVGPEAPLSAGLVDRLRGHRIPAFGPSARAARIESSKSYAKQLMVRAGVPTARAITCVDVAAARRAIADIGAPVVIKASGLAAGKGVAVCATVAEAEAAAAGMLEGGTMGAAGQEVLVEEFMEGEELSLFALTDGRNALPMLPAQDHKRLLDGDRGPNTGGMGAYAPVGLGTTALVREAIDRIILPTLAALHEDDSPFSGLLYAGLMLTASGPRVVEFNCRFGDPETEAILPLLRSNLLELLHAVGAGGGIDGAGELAWADGAAVTTIVASAGYPGSVRKGVVIDSLPSERPTLRVFHAGTARDDRGRLVTAGGRVIAVTATGPTFAAARTASVHAASEVRFDGAVRRSDIGWREAARSGAGAS